MYTQIQDTQCSAGPRKDCINKKTCFLRHFDEEVGKDITYYAAKYARKTRIEPELAPSPVPPLKSFRVADFEKKVVPGDGHCIIHSVLAALEQRGTSVPTTIELLEKLKPTLQSDLDLLAPFINTTKTDPLAEIQAYVELANYNNSIVDFVIPLISKILDKGICVLQLDTAGNVYETNDLLTYPSSSVDPLYVLKSGSHYDALLPRSHNTTSQHDSVSVLDEDHVPKDTHSPNVSKDDDDDDVMVVETSNQTTCESGLDTSNPTNNESDLDPARVLAALCAGSPDYEVLHCLRNYSSANTLKRQTVVFNKFNVPTLKKTSDYLNIVTDGLKKPNLIHVLICRIQNLLPETCFDCKATYVTDLNSTPLLACHKCGQEVHRPCFLAKLGIEEASNADLDSLINPLGLPGIHYFCPGCEEEMIPPDNLKKVKTLTKAKPRPSPVAKVLCDPKIVNTVSEVILKETNAFEKPNQSSSAVNDLPTADNNLSDVGYKQVNKKICTHYKKNQCKFGLKGKGCPFSHPVKCKKFLAHGTKQPGGCNLGKNCSNFHPKMCNTSLTKGVCFDQKCQLSHVKGTKRKRPNIEPEKTQQKFSQSKTTQLQASTGNHVTPVNSSMVSEENTNSNQSSFLSMISLLRKELSEAVDTKIMNALRQFPIMQPPIQPPMLSTNFTHPQVPIRPQQIPTFPPWNQCRVLPVQQQQM